MSLYPSLKIKTQNPYILEDIKIKLRILLESFLIQKSTRQINFMGKYYYENVLANQNITAKANIL